MSNLWLNPALRGGPARRLPEPRQLPEPRGLAAAAGAEFGAPPEPASHSAYRRPRRQGTHPTLNRRSPQRLWMRLAAGLLLLGSAAFSYLAWSEAGLPRTIAPYANPAHGPGALTTATDIERRQLAADSPPAYPSDSAYAGAAGFVGTAAADVAADTARLLATARSRVHALRQENAALHQRIHTIESRLRAMATGS